MQPRSGFIDCKNPKKWKIFPGGHHRLHYLEWGDAASSKSVICVHGLTRNARDFDFLAQTLVQEGYRVICPDIPGRGKSTWLKKAQWYSYPLYRADMLELMRHLKLTAPDWIGTSMGGLIGIVIEAAKPGTFRKLVLNDVGPFIPKAALNRIGRYVGTQMRFPSRTDAFQSMQEIMVPFGIREQQHWEHIFEHSFIPEADGGYRYSYDPAIAEAFRDAKGQPRELSDLNLWGWWDRISCPVLVVHGEESDVLTQETATAMAGHKNVTLYSLENIGHAPMLMEANQIALVADWLKALN